MRTITARAAKAINAIDSYGRTFWLAYVTVGGGGQIRACNAPTAQFIQGYWWQALPFRVDGIEFDASGEIMPVTVTLPGITPSFRNLVDQYRGFYDASWELHQVADGEVVDSLYLRTKSATRGADVLSFELGAEDILNQRFPQNRVIRSHCQHVYGDRDPNTLCQYPVSTAGSLKTCDRTLHGPNGCFAHGAHAEDVLLVANGRKRWPRRFGGFPGIVIGQGG